jgi:hypothetical protein
VDFSLELLLKCDVVTFQCVAFCFGLHKVASGRYRSISTIKVLVRERNDPKSLRSLIFSGIFEPASIQPSTGPEKFAL